MIWFNLSKLEKKIIEKDFSDEEGFSYFLAFSILGVIASYVGSSSSFISFLECIILIAITIWGSNAIFRVNQKGDGQEFFKRFFALSWVIGFRIFIVVLGASFVLIVGLDLAGDEQILGEENNNMATLVISSLIEVIYFLLLIASFRKVSQATKTE